MSTLVRAGMTPAERCRYVADLIEAHPENFDMHVWISGPADGYTLFEGVRPDATECGTTCCIAGWAVVVTPPAEINQDCVFSFGRSGQVLLDVDEDDYLELFHGDWEAPEAAFLLRWHADELDRA